MEANDHRELEAVQRLTLRLREAHTALLTGTVAGAEELAVQQELLCELLALRSGVESHSADPGLAAAVLELQDIVASFEHTLRVGMAQIQERLNPSSPTSASSFADRIGRGHSLGSA